MSVGNFDGVHRGHAALVEQGRELAKTVDGPVVLVTFDPHPLQLLAPERFQPLLTSADVRAELLAAVGADAVVILQTDADLLNLTADAFFEQILLERFGARGIVEGFNFRFGHDRKGTVDMLRDKCGFAGIPLRIVDPFQMGDMVVSSSRVRNALMSGDVALGGGAVESAVSGARHGRGRRTARANDRLPNGQSR